MSKEKLVPVFFQVTEEVRDMIDETAKEEDRKRANYLQTLFNRIHRGEIELVVIELKQKGS